MTAFPLNILSPTSCELWLQLVARPDEEDLSFQILSPFGHVPTYWHQLNPEFDDSSYPAEVVEAQRAVVRDHLILSELQDGSFTSVLNIGWVTEELPERWSLARSVIRWAQRQGLALQQPFKVRLTGTPQQFETDCGTEYDVDFAVTILERQSIDPQLAAQRWQAWRDTDTQRTLAMRQAMRELIQRRHKDVSAMYISRFYYGPDHATYVAYRLCSSHTSVEGFTKGTSPDFFEVRDENALPADLLQRFYREVRAKYPHIPVETLVIR